MSRVHKLYFNKIDEVDFAGFSKRTKKKTIKDCFLILQSNENSLAALLTKGNTKGTILAHFLTTGYGVFDLGNSRVGVSKNGRFPTNVVLRHSPICTDTCHDTCPVLLMDQSSGERASYNCEAKVYEEETGRILGSGIGKTRSAGYDDEGGASRYYYQARNFKELFEYLNQLLKIS